MDMDKCFSVFEEEDNDYFEKRIVDKNILILRNSNYLSVLKNMIQKMIGHIGVVIKS